MMKRDEKSWKIGYQAGLAGQVTMPPAGVDEFTWYAGLVQGHADRSKASKNRKTPTKPKAKRP